MQMVFVMEAVCHLLLHSHFAMFTKQARSCVTHVQNANLVANSCVGNEYKLYEWKKPQLQHDNIVLSYRHLFEESGTENEETADKRHQR